MYPGPDKSLLKIGNKKRTNVHPIQFIIVEKGIIFGFTI